jgi:uncharacterized delta-60 repeat protein
MKRIASHLFIFSLLTFSTFSQDGTLDNTFDSDGKVTYTLFDSSCVANDVQVQADGKIVVGGYQSDATGFIRDFILLRYNVDGSLDNSFDGDGKALTEFGATNASTQVSSIAIQDDEKIVAVGTFFSGGSHAAIARYNTDGSLDNTFGIAGKDTMNLYGSIEVETVKIQDDGKIVFIASVSGEIVVLRLNTDGSLDNSFDSDGKVVLDPTVYDDYCSDFAIQDDGKIVICGFSFSPTYDILLLRLNADGSLDASFDSDGIVVMDDQALNLQANAVEIQSDGKIVAGGWQSGNDFIMLRYNTDGSLDPSFDTDGILTANFGGSSDCQDIVIQNNGKIVVGGDVGITGIGNLFAIGRFNTDGSFDPTFDGDGIQTTTFSIDDDYAFGLAKQPDGKFLLAGKAETFGGPYEDGLAIARYNNSDDLAVIEIGMNLQNLNVFPNPANSSVTIQLDSEIANGTLEIHTIDGELVSRRRAVNGDKITVQTSTYPSGKYLLSLIQEGHLVGEELLIISQ